MASIQQEGDAYYCQFCYLGKRHTVTIGPVSRDEADAFAGSQESLEPVLAATGEGGNVRPRIGTTDNGTQGHGDDVEKQMTLAAVDPWVLEVA